MDISNPAKGRIKVAPTKIKYSCYAKTYNRNAQYKKYSIITSKRTIWLNMNCVLIFADVLN
jgi:hypothetical protein